MLSAALNVKLKTALTTQKATVAKPVLLKLVTALLVKKAKPLVLLSKQNKILFKKIPDFKNRVFFLFLNFKVIKNKIFNFTLLTNFGKTNLCIFKCK